jgi:hypothetical protein
VTDKPDVDLERARICTGTAVSDTKQAAGGLEALQREWREKRNVPGPSCISTRVFERCADALAPHIAAAKEREEKLWALLNEWKVERDAKCDACRRGLDLGAHGCHFDGDAEESYSVGNCKAWPLSRRIKQLEEAIQS